MNQIARYGLVAGMLALTTSVLGTSAVAQTTLSAPLPDNIRSRGQIIIGTYCDYPPFGYVGADQSVQGIEVDYGHKVAELAFGKPDAVKFECVKSDQRIPYLQTGKVDLLISVLGVTIDRAKVIDFSEPYFASTTVFLAQKGHEFQSFADLRGKTLLLSSGTPWITWLQRCEPKIEMTQYDSIPNQLEAMNAGRGVALLNDSTLLYPIAAKNPNFVVTGPDVKEQGYSWAFGVKKGNQALLSWVNAAIDEMQKEDFFWQTVQHWEKDPATLQGLEKVVRRPGHTPDYSSYQASVTAEPSCPK
jgi:polar amino acid transport system substrate-binding protein